MNRLICQACNRNLATAAKLLGVADAKRWHSLHHRLQVSEAAMDVVALARIIVSRVSDRAIDALRQALLRLDEQSAGLERGYLEYDREPERTTEEST